MSERKLSKESSDDQAQLYVDYYEVGEQIGDEKKREETVQTFIDLLSPLFQTGKISLCTDGGFFVIQHLKDGTELKYKEIDGSAKLEMDKAAKRGEHAKTYALLGYLSGMGESVISKLKSKDLDTAEGLAVVFLEF